MFQGNTLALPEAFSGILNSMEKSWIILQAIIEPIIFRFKSYRYPGRLTMPCDNNLFLFCKTQIFGKIIFYFR